MHIVLAGHHPTSPDVNEVVQATRAAHVALDVDGVPVARHRCRPLVVPPSALYNAETLFVASKDTVRTYDSETGEFLETFVSKPGMDASSMVFHDM